MLPNLKTTAIAAVTALSIAATSATPAAAWGQREQDFVKGAATALILKAIIDDANRSQKSAPVYREESRQTYYEEPPREKHGGHRSHEDQPRTISIYGTPAAKAFNSYSRAERRLIQKRLAHWGYYRGGIDGSFGPGTYSAIMAYAADKGTDRDLRSTTGAFGVFDGLIF